MRHFPDETWVDWARGIQTESLRDEIREHLSSGCVECRTSVDTWKNVYEIAGREASYEPPPGVLSRARALFAEHAPRAESKRPIEVARLLFDSFSSPLPAGVRNLERATRHMSYKAGTFFIDVRIEEEGSSGLASVIGQLMHHPDAPSAPLEGLSVILTSGRSTLGETTTNRFGEFSFEVDTSREHQIAIGVGDEFAVVVPLGGLRGRA